MHSVRVKSGELYKVGPGAPKEAVDPATLSLSEHVKLYNLVGAQIGYPRIKAFRDKKTGTRRLVDRLKEYGTRKGKATGRVDHTAGGTEDTGISPPDSRLPDAEDKERKKAPSVNFLGMRTDISPGDEIVSLKKKGTTMTRLLPLLLAGATLKQLTTEFAAIDAERGRTSKRPTRIRIYEAIRCFAYHHGYGTRSTQDTITLIVK